MEFDNIDELKQGIMNHIEVIVDKELQRVKCGEGVAIDCRLYPIKEDGTYKDEVNMRNDTEYFDWRKAVFERDNYTCVECGTKGRLHAHHIKEWASSVSERFNIDNGITLCVECHCKKHPEHANLIRKARAKKVI